MRVLAHGPLGELDATAVLFQFLDQPYLMDILPGQPVRCGDQYHIQVCQGRHISQPVQSRPTKTGTTMAVIPVDLLVLNPPILLLGVGLKPTQLLLDGLVLSLALSGYSDIKCYSHEAPPVEDWDWAGPLPTAGGDGRPGPNDAARRSPLKSFAEPAISVPQLPPR
jgi:hypothetical protein